jgi:hypothetical protein
MATVLCKDGNHRLGDRELAGSLACLMLGWVAPGCAGDFANRAGPQLGESTVAPSAPDESVAHLAERRANAEIEQAMAAGRLEQARPHTPSSAISGWDPVSNDTPPSPAEQQSGEPPESGPASDPPLPAR